MIAAFEAGGDFHSRTAMGMYPHVAEAVAKGEVLLEGDDAPGGAPKPLLKNVFANERRKAKILNFSIAYGKTALGLSRDWNVSLGEAKDTVEKWYADRPEVREWQQRVIADARRQGATRTLLGRYRDLPDITNPDIRRRSHAERAAINTPIQGSAADVAMGAMLKLWRDEELARLGWRMVLQIHDEIILEGPEGTADAALALATRAMALPFDRPLLVELVVDAKVCASWYEGK
jgi:DNA polymerase-1